MKALYATFVVAKSIDCDGMIGGQVVDIITKNKELNEYTLKYINRLKLPIQHIFCKIN